MTHYVIVRDDLPRGVVAAQVIHAAGHSVRGELPERTHAVALAARDREDLERLERQLIQRSIAHRAIREPDAPWCGALMAIGIAPVRDRRSLRRVLGSLPLLR
ncbi:MAG: peptidyl-tRNA hydrolase [Myxococcota bacterium]